MKIPQRLEPLVEDGLIDYVIKPLKSGKEADLFVVVKGDDFFCAKIYKEKTHRTFHSQVLYQEGRNRRNSRSSRALGKHSKYGKKVEEQEWQESEIDTLVTLQNANVCVPKPHICLHGVLLMQLILDSEGEVAPQIGEVVFDQGEARYCHDYLLREIIKMLLAGVVHADLSEFNIVMAHNGPVIIDFPQAVDATSNNNAQFFFERDIQNITAFFGRFAPELLTGNFGLEIWQHYKAATLTPEITLTGKPVVSTKEVDIDAVVTEIEDARRDAEYALMRQEGVNTRDSNAVSAWYQAQGKEEPPKRHHQKNKHQQGQKKHRGEHPQQPSGAPHKKTSKKSEQPTPKEPMQWGRRV